MTLRGIYIIFIELLLVILALGTEFKKFLVVALCLGGLIIYSFLSLVLAAFTLGVKSEADKNLALRKETVKYTLSVYGFVLLSVTSHFFVRTVDNSIVEKKKFRHSFVLPPSFSIKRKFVFEMSCAHIGNWDIGVKRMRIEDLFGLFSLPLLRCRKSDFLVRLSIMPNIHDLDEIEERNSSGGFGDTNLISAEDGELLGDSRVYREGDSLKRINWKQSVRTKKLYSRLFEMTKEPTVVIAIDMLVGNNSREGTVDIICESALSLANYFIGHNNSVRVVFVRGADDAFIKHIDLVSLNDIAKLQQNFIHMLFKYGKEELDLSLNDNNQMFDANRIYFISSNPSQGIVATLDNINKSGKVACCIVPCDEFSQGDISYSGKTGENTLVYIDSADQIKEKVGTAL